MPYPGVPANQTAKVERCVNKVLARGIKPRNPKQSAKSVAVAVCVAQIRGEDELENLITKHFEVGENMKDRKYIEHLMQVEGLSEDEAVLTTKTRKALPGTAFCGPERSYPAHDMAHARNALARVSQFGSPALQKRVRACVYRKFPGLKARKQARENINENFSENLVFSFNEKNIDEQNRLVRVCALAPCISKNNRYYSPQVVESVSGTLIGKKSFADHDQRNTKNLIGRIKDEEFKDGKIYADIKVSNASGVAKSTWQKIIDSTITDVSIAADGKTKRVKIGDKYGDEVISLDIKSVDFVTEGGVAHAKVMRVFESVNDYPQVEEVEQKIMKDVNELRNEYPDLVAEVEEAKVSEVEEKMKDELEKLRKENEDLKFKLVEKELAEYKKTEIDKLDINDKVKNVLRQRVNGKTKEELASSLKTELELANTYKDAHTQEAEVEGVPEGKKKKTTKAFTSQSIREDTTIPEEFKGKAIELLWNKGEKASKDYLKSNGIEL